MYSASEAIQPEGLSRSSRLLLPRDFTADCVKKSDFNHLTRSESDQ